MMKTFLSKSFPNANKNDKTRCQIKSLKYVTKTLCSRGVLGAEVTIVVKFV